jgi:hypothetical protein
VYSLPFVSFSATMFLCSKSSIAMKLERSIFSPIQYPARWGTIRLPGFSPVGTC